MIPLYDFFFIGCLFGLIVIVAARMLGKLPLLYGSFNSRILEIQQAFERFDKWHKSWKYYKEPKVINWNDPASKLRAREIERLKRRREMLQDPLPGYLGGTSQNDKKTES